MSSSCPKVVNQPKDNGEGTQTFCSFAQTTELTLRKITKEVLLELLQHTYFHSDVVKIQQHHFYPASSCSFPLPSIFLKLIRYKLTFSIKWEGMPASSWQLIIDPFSVCHQSWDLPNCRVGLSMLYIHPGAVSYGAGYQLTSQTAVLKGISSLTVTTLEESTQGQKQTSLSVRSVTRVWNLVWFIAPTKTQILSLQWKKI